ncbi:MAG TPA: TonB-dependent receptor [Polyangiaceae bacterium]|nr:TonB-dependent receptor [Polyangiaceae bacterium]
MMDSLASSVMRSSSGSNTILPKTARTLRSLTTLATLGVGLMISSLASAQQTPPAPAPAPQEPAQQPAAPPAAPPSTAPAAPPNAEQTPPPPSEQAPPPSGEQPPPPDAQQPTPRQDQPPPAPPPDGAQPTERADDSQLEGVVVAAEKITEADLTRAKQQEIGGTTSIVTSEEVDKGRKATAADVLQRQPGVYVEQVGGSDAVKISIRGSGINNGPGFFRQGINFLFDGLSITGAGGTSYEMLNGQALDYVEVLNGANAFEYGALGLGGAINFHTQNGLTTPGLNLRVETGSYGYQRQTASYGGKLGRLDYYVNLSNYRNTGYQDYALAKSAGAVLNIGYQFSDRLSTRLIGRYTEEWHQTNGPLTKQQLESDPTQFGGTVKSGSGSERPGAIWVGDTTTYRFGDGSQVSGGLAVYHYEHINGRNGTNPGWWNWTDLNVSLRYSRDDSWWGHQAKSYIAYNQTQHLATAEVRSYTQPLWTDKGGPQTGWQRYSYSWNRALTAGLDFAVTPQLWLTAGLGVASIRRNVKIEQSRFAITGDPYEDLRFWKVAPRVGLRYGITPKVNAFASYTRTYDPESDWNHVGTGGAVIDGKAVSTQFVKALVPQQADTFEIGVKGQASIFDGSLALYRANIKDELLSAQVAPQGWDGKPDTPALRSSFNAPTPTVHQGIEVGLSTRLWEGPKPGDGVVFYQSYTLNDFHYKSDPEFGSNALPGQPLHIYNGDLQLQLAGFYVGPNVRAVSKTPVDYANTLYSDGYALVGAKAGYVARDKKWSFYVDLRNLANVHHANAVATTATAVTDPNQQKYFYAGDGRGIYFGLNAHPF